MFFTPREYRGVHYVNMHNLIFRYLISIIRVPVAT